MRIGDHQHSSLVYFYHTGIGGKNTINSSGWKIRTLKTLFKELGDSGVCNISLKSKYFDWKLDTHSQDKAAFVIKIGCRVTLLLT